MITRRSMILAPAVALAAPRPSKLQQLKAGEEISTVGVRIRAVEQAGEVVFLVTREWTDADAVIVEVFHNTEKILNLGGIELHKPTSLVLRAALLDITLVGEATTMSDPVPIKLADLHSIRVRPYMELNIETVREREKK